MTPCPRPLPFKLSTSPHPQTTRLLPAAPAEASLLSHPRAGGRDPIWSPCPRGENRALPPEAPRAMEGTLLALWALLVGWDAGLLRRGPGAAPQGFVGSTSQPGRNLTCYRCFKVASAALCAPTACSPSDRVCVSHAVSFFLRSVSWAEAAVSLSCPESRQARGLSVGADAAPRTCHLPATGAAHLAIRWQG
ncbi:lymphocyte antigen 6L isoform X9 [Artibeus jamaicensis]|uniref:lymphocyte antigen 6L isoform X9 n=1 Tax=Artibeus jamaicensis TaxID=9417 RepID=UPI00235A6140|nr:lymphocyte antigen 6L isoform X9 [Artibeus jamaicensis]